MIDCGCKPMGGEVVAPLTGEPRHGLGVEPVSRPPVTREAIVAEARAWIGTPFVHNQSLKGAGVDCVGLLVGIGRALAMPAYDRWANDQRFRGYTPTPNPALLLKACGEYLLEIPVTHARLGDILQYTFAKEPMHFAVISREAPRYVIHAYQRAKGVVENGATATFWRLQRAFSFPGVV